MLTPPVIGCGPFHAPAPIPCPVVGPSRCGPIPMPCLSESAGATQRDPHPPFEITPHARLPLLSSSGALKRAISLSASSSSAPTSSRSVPPLSRTSEATVAALRSSPPPTRGGPRSPAGPGRRRRRCRRRRRRPSWSSRRVRKRPRGCIARRAAATARLRLCPCRRLNLRLYHREGPPRRLDPRVGVKRQQGREERVHQAVKVGREQRLGPSSEVVAS